MARRRPATQRESSASGDAVTALFLSDLHLPNRPSPLRDQFRRFLHGPARDADQVYILGDLFEYWIGDDVGLDDYAREAGALRDLVDYGVHVFLIHGNRDFLVADAFERETGVRLLVDPTVLQLNGVSTLIGHGDAFCTDDIAYQRWRAVVRGRTAPALFRRLPERWRRRVASGLREQSRVHQARMGNLITDVNEDAVRQAFQQHAVTRIIHGHTHRPAEHRYDVDGRQRERIVLADWRPTVIEYLRVDGAGMRRISLV